MPANNTGVRTGYLAGRFPSKIGHLFSPGGERGPLEFIPYSLDNGAYGAYLARKEWDCEAWVRLLDWANISGQTPLWAIVPDVVGNKVATLRNWSQHAGTVARYGWKLAFAVQDGMVPNDVPNDADVIFVGGSTEWKWATVGLWCANFPRVHVGRVNTYRRLWQCHDLGAESIDGTGWMRGDQVQYRGLLAYLEESTGSRHRVTQYELATR
jgi:hypothetical protein